MSDVININSENTPPRKNLATLGQVKDALDKRDEQITSLKEDKITKPAEAPTIGKILRVKSVNEDGTFVCEWADGGSELDVRINGESIVQDGVAEIPLCTKTKRAGLITIDTYFNNGGLYRANESTGLIRIMRADERIISARNNEFTPIVPSNFDYTVKAAMCDGKGAAWTVDEQASARERIGIDDWEDVITYTTSNEEENSTICYIDFEHTYKKIYVLIDESAIDGTIYSSTRFGIIDKNKIHNEALLANTTPAFNAKQKYKTFSAEVVNTQGISYKYMAASGVQLLGYTESPSIGRVGSPSASGVDVSAIGGLAWLGTMYAGTVIKVIGVRA